MARRQTKGWGTLKLKDIERRRQEALGNQDAPNYYNFCVEAGLTLDDAEDKALYERGCVEFVQIEAAADALDSENPANASLDNAVAEEFEKQHDERPAETADPDRVYWADLARIVLPRFQESERRNGIKTREIRGRLTKAHSKAYRTDLEVTERLEVADVSDWARNRMWNYLTNDLKPRTQKGAEKYCMDVLREIYAKNAQQKRDAQIR